MAYVLEDNVTFNNLKVVAMQRMLGNYFSNFKEDYWKMETLIR